MASRKVKQVANEAYLEKRADEFTLPDGTVVRRGDPLAVKGESGSWKLSYVWNGEPVLYGGDPGYGHLRSFRIERLSIPKKRHKRNLSDAHKELLRARLASMREAKQGALEEATI